MSEPNAPGWSDEMDELTAVQQLLAERPPPSPDAVAAARASLDRAGLHGTPGRVPLHLNGSGGMPGLGQPAPRRRWRGWLVPVAAALAVTTAVAVSLAISSGISRQQARTHHARPVAPFAQVPRYLVALTGGNILPNGGRRAVVAATATGTVLGSVTPPPPYRVFTWVAAAGNDRTFVLAAQRAQLVNGAPHMFMGTGPAKFYRLTVRRSGRPGALRPLPVPPVTESINGFALSPDGTKLAVSTTRTVGAAAGGSQIQVFTLATGAVRSWALGKVGWVGQDKPNAGSLAWAGDDRTLLFKQYLGEGGSTAQIRLLDTAAPGGFLAAASALVPFPGRLISGRVEDPVQDYGNMLLTPDGHKIISVVATSYWHARPGFIPQGSFARITRSMLPPQCQGTGRSVYKRTPYCINTLKQLERGKTGKSAALRRALIRNAAQQLAQSSTVLAFTEFSAATAKPLAVLSRLQGEGQGTTWAEVTWTSPDGSAMIIDGAWPKAGGHWPISHAGPPVPVAGVLTGGTFTPFPRPVQSLFFGGQAAW
jgi:hypothetical protein